MVDKNLGGEFMLVIKIKNIRFRQIKRANLYQLKWIKLCLLITIIAYPPAVGFAANSLSQFGITWTFNKELSTNGTGNTYRYGQFANGDYWVLGPVTIININPPSVEIGGRVKNGSMVNPSPALGKTQGYDSSMQRTIFDASYNVARPNNQDLSASNPLVLQPGSSLVSTISVEAAGQRPQLQTAVVLTVLGSSAQEGSFRPPYAGNNKPVYLTSNLRKNLLPNLDLVVNTPNIRGLIEGSKSLERVWLDHFKHDGGDMTQYTSPIDNMYNYGREYAIVIGEASLLLMLNEQKLIDQQGINKDLLLIRFVQLGIDLYYIAKEGNNWKEGGGLNQGRKWPILFAGLMLDDANMKNIGFSSTTFQEDLQTWNVTQSDVGRALYHGDGRPREEYLQEDVGLPEWGEQHTKQPERDGRNWDAVYREIFGISMPGIILSAQMMGQKNAWNHDALFDYIDRWVDVQTQYIGNSTTEAYRVYGSDFIKNMWKAYRANYGCVWRRYNTTDINSNGYNPCTSDIVPPLPPTNLASTNQTESSINLSWTPAGSASDGDLSSIYRIFRGGVLVGQAAGTSFLDTALSAKTSYSYKVYSVDDAGNQSASAATGTFTTLADTKPPSIVSVNAYKTSVEILFNETLDRSSAENISNYAVTGGVLINSVSLNSEQNRVILSTSTNNENVSYTLTVVNVKDTVGNPMPETTIDYKYDSGLIGLWHFDEGSGTVANDSSGKDNVGTLINGSTWTGGKINSALGFDGIDDYVRVRDSSTLRPENGSWTISIWAKPPNQNLSVPIVAKRQNASPYEQFDLGISGPDSHSWPSGKKIVFNYIEAVSRNERSGYTTDNVVDGEWHHIVTIADKDYDTIRMYVDGQERSVVVEHRYGSWPTINNSDDLQIGGENSSLYFNGIIDEVRIYNRALSADEVLNLFNEAGSLVFEPIGDKQVDVGSTLTFEVITQNSAQQVSIEADPNLPFDPNVVFVNKVFSWTPTSDGVGSYEVTFVAPRGQYEDFETITITVNSVKINQAPVLGAIGNKSVSEGSTLSFSVNATDPDGDTVAYSVQNLPSGATFSGSTFNWTPASGQASSYQVTFITSDGQLEDFETITITVNSVKTNQAPELGAIGNKSVSKGSTLSFSVNATDPDGDTVTYSVQNLPSGATFSGSTFSWKPKSGQVGSYQVTFIASDGQLQDFETITITVNNVYTNQAPVLGAIGNKSVSEGSTLSFSVNATDPDGDTVAYSVQNLPSGATFSGSTFSWTPGYGQAGSYQVTFIASDGQLQDTETITITVTSAGPSLSDNLVGYWKMNDNASNTTVVDSSGKGNNGTARRNTSALSTTGKVNGALSFNGSSDYVSCGSNSSLNLIDAISVGVWVKFDTLSFDQGIVDKGDSPTDGVIRLWLWHGNNEVFFDAPEGAVRINGAPSGGFSTGRWYHIVASYNRNGGSNNLNLYIDGVKVASLTKTAAMGTNSHNLTIGARRQGKSEFFDGAIDNVMIFNKALSQQEIDTLYNGGAGLETF